MAQALGLWVSAPMLKTWLSELRLLVLGLPRLLVLIDLRLRVFSSFCYFMASLPVPVP